MNSYRTQHARIGRSTGARALLRGALDAHEALPEVRDTTREAAQVPGARRVELRWHSDEAPPEPRLRAVLRGGVMALRRAAPTGCSTLLAYRGEALVGAAVTTGPGTPLVWQRGEDAAAASEIVRALAEHPDAIACAYAVGAILKQRAVTTRFFPEVRRAVERIGAGWVAQHDLDGEARRRLALQLVCRLLFVRFVEQKGWLGGDLHLLAGLVLEPGARDIYRERLRPLFLEVLNRPLAERSRNTRFDAVPFLNGGLFAPSRDELAHAELDLPDAIVVDVYDRLFVRWRFVASSDAHDGDAIDPAMLGHVFERLMDADERSRTGTWYTPPALVKPMVQDAIGRAIRERAGRDINEAGSASEASTMLAVVDGIRVLDPACGSGAFLLGALEELARLRVTLAARAGRAESDAEARRRVLTRNLFGIDVSETAVGLAELRLWLALAAAMPDGPGEHVVPLPNLGHHIRHGDALISPWQASWSGGISVPAATAAAMREVGRALAEATGAQKSALEKRLRGLERQAADELQRASLRRIERRIAELEATRLDLFGERIPLGRTELRELEVLRRQRTDLLVEAAIATGHGRGVAFDARLHFAEAMDDGGFDVVIGNPPWVRLSELPPEQRALLRMHYRWMGESGGGRVFGAQPDLAVAFVERSAQLARAGGIVSMLVPSKLFTAGFAHAMRRDLIEQHDLIEVSEEDHRGAPFAADVYPARLVFAAWRRPRGRVAVRAGTGESCELPSAQLGLGASRGAAWALAEAGNSAELEVWMNAAPALAERVPVRLGVKTGANEVFVGVGAPLAPRVPAVRGRDLRAFAPVGSTSLLFGHHVETGEVLAELDGVTREWLAAFDGRLRERRDTDARLPVWQLFRVRADALGHRVAWRDLAPRLEACPLQPVAAGGPVALNSVYTVAVPTHEHALRLAAWLNTTPARRIAAAGADPALGGYRRFFASNVGLVPVPEFVWSGEGEAGARLLAVAMRLHESPEDDAALAELDAIASTWATHATRTERP